MQGLKNKEQMFKQKYEKYNKILNQLMWLNACSSGISIATGISSAASLTGAIASGITSTQLKSIKRNLRK